MLLTSFLTSTLAALASAAPLLNVGAEAGVGASVNLGNDLKVGLQAAVFTSVNIGTCYSPELEGHAKSVPKKEARAQFVLDLVAAIEAKYPGYNCFVYPKKHAGGKIKFEIDVGAKGKESIKECQVESFEHEGKKEWYGIVVFQGTAWLEIGGHGKGHGKGHGNGHGKDKGVKGSNGNHSGKKEEGGEGCHECQEPQPEPATEECNECEEGEQGKEKEKDWGYGGKYTEEEGGKKIVFQDCGCA